MTWLRRWLRILGPALGTGLCAAGSAWAENAWLGYDYPLAVSYPFPYPYLVHTDPRTGQPILPWDASAPDSG